jgi:hypothetical protein
MNHVTTRALAMTRNGRFVVLRQADGIHIIDALGPRPRRVIDAAGTDVACVGGEAWWIGAGGVLERVALADDEAMRPVVRLPEAIHALTPSADGTAALVEGAGGTWLVDADRATAVEIDCEPGTRVIGMLGRRIVEASRDRAALRTIGRRDAVALPRLGGIALAATFVLGGRAIAVWVRGATEDALVVCSTTGKLVHRIATAPLGACAFAEDANLAIGAAGEGLTALDLRYGKVRATRAATPAGAIAIDRLGRHLVAMTRDDGALMRIGFDELFAAAPDAPEVIEPAPEVVLPRVAAAEPTPCAEPAIPDHAPLALAPPPGPRVVIAPNGAAPYRDAAQHLAALLDVVAARTALAIAESWHSGRTSHDGDGDLPCEREVLGLLGEDVGLAADALHAARIRLRDRACELALRTEATVAADIALPLHVIAREHALSAIAMQILVCAAAPRLRTSIARLYGVLAGLAGRSVCADHLLEVLVEPDADRDVSQVLAIELAPDAPLVTAGLVVLQPRPDRVEIGVDAVLVDRLRGIERATQISDATLRRTSSVALRDVIAPAAVKRALVLGLAERAADRPARIVVRGRNGSGRHTIIGALAAQVGRAVAAIDATLLPPDALPRELRRANLAGCVPVVSGLESVPREAWLHVRTMLSRHPGPLAVRAPVDAELPLAPDALEVELPPLALGERAQAWSRALAARGLATLATDELAMFAARFRFGPGTIERVVDEVARRAQRDSAELASLIEDVARQHIAGRLARVATRVTRLPDWDQVTLVDDMRDSVRALIGRMQHQRTVYEDWGFDGRITTARGLTALFYGPPGTGKTLVASLIGRELGLEVWRIDLARVMSKWVGETEKSLADVFNAAEEGNVMLLFDEADSLFGKRSEVKSSNDRYANLETNYLLQRLDAFEGVAILTTNLEGSIDPAFKRRLSMRLFFPFPDEEQRASLWAAHIPPGVPRAGHLDFADLARRYPLSGGYIRNSALRAAFLAAQEQRPLTQDHLVRAVQLEYRELGKLSTSGRMD